MNALREYLEQTCDQPPLSDEETRRLVSLTRHGHAHVKRWALGKLVRHNMRLVAARAKRYRYSGIDYRDLMQVGVLGLVRAIELYDGQKAALSTYAAIWIDAKIRKHINSHATIIRQPDWRREQMRILQDTREELEGENGEEPTLEELADETGIPQADVERLYLTGYTVSLDVRAGNDEDDDMALLNFLPGGPENAEAPAEVSELWDAVAGVVSELTEIDPRLPRIFYEYYVLGFNMTEIGEHFGVTRQRIQQIRKRAMPALREALSGNEALRETWQTRDCRLHRTPASFVLPMDFGS